MKLHILICRHEFVKLISYWPEKTSWIEILDRKWQKVHGKKEWIASNEEYILIRYETKSFLYTICYRMNQSLDKSHSAKLSLEVQIENSKGVVCICAFFSMCAKPICVPNVSIKNLKNTQRKWQKLTYFFGYSPKGIDWIVNVRPKDTAFGNCRNSLNGVTEGELYAIAQINLKIPFDKITQTRFHRPFQWIFWKYNGMKSSFI